MAQSANMPQHAHQAGLSKLFKFLLKETDIDSLRLDKAPDDGARICRAWLLNGHADNPHHLAAGQLLSLAKDQPVARFLSQATSDLSNIDVAETDLWQYFCPPAAEADRDAQNMAAEITRRRRLSSVEPARHPLADPANELLFTANALISPPLEPDSPNIPPALRAEARRFTEQPQDFWYDHPVPLDAAPSENEILYGLANLDEALAQECALGTLPDSARIDLAMSISVTHEGMETLASDYVRDLISRHLKLRHLRVFLFDERHCRKIVGAVCAGDSQAETVFGVNGAYGRHYSFLKAVLLVWQMAVNPRIRFTFKIDLDQVFEQAALRTHTGRSALQLLCNPLWGGRAVDHLGRDVELGMLAGGLVNESDSQRGLFVPDVTRPDTASLITKLGSRRVFCPQWPQAISTEAEIMQRDGGCQRVHVTGGTTGICDMALRRWKPFTPGFINRAEDQAYALSAFDGDGYLAHLHAPGLIMRHDKQAFAARAMAHADAGKAIGDIERLMLFSRYADLHGNGFDTLRNHLWPFTSCFLHPRAPALAGLIFALDGAVKGGRYVAEGASRLTRCLEFCQTGMADQLALEKSGWQAVYDGLNAERKPPAGLTDTIAAAMTERSG